MKIWIRNEKVILLNICGLYANWSREGHNVLREGMQEAHLMLLVSLYHEHLISRKKKKKALLKAVYCVMQLSICYLLYTEILSWHCLILVQMTGYLNEEPEENKVNFIISLAEFRTTFMES